MSRQLLVTGGCGFIGTNLIRFLRRERPDWRLVNLDALTYAGQRANLADLEGDPHYRFVHGDVNDWPLLEALLGECDAVIHLAAQTHVDRSIQDAGPFVQANVLGTQSLLDALRSARQGGHACRLVHVSTDEVYGTLPLEPAEAAFSELSPLAPRSPYAASKAGSDLLVQAAWHTHGLESCIVRPSNNLGPYQYPEKLIPFFLRRLLAGETVPLYGDGLHVRDWLHVEDHARALLAVLENGVAGEIYNVGGDNQRSNLELTRTLLAILNLPEDRIAFVPDRPGHDRRYALDTGKLRRELGWRPVCSAWPEALEATVRWYLDHPDWFARTDSPAYRDYLKRQYGRGPGRA